MLPWPKRKNTAALSVPQKLINQAFLELLREKPFEKITVTDVVKGADINRSAFYAHYPDVRGLVEALMDQAVNSPSA